MARKSIVIGIALVMLMEFSGCFVLLNYSVAIFIEAGSNITPNESVIVMGLIQAIGSYVSLHLVDKAGRRVVSFSVLVFRKMASSKIINSKINVSYQVLLITSAFGTGLGMLLLGLFNYLKSSNSKLALYNWIPLLCFCFIIFIGNCGILSLPFVVVAELLPEKV